MRQWMHWERNTFLAKLSGYGWSVTVRWPPDRAMGRAAFLEAQGKQGPVGRSSDSCPCLRFKGEAGLDVAEIFGQFPISEQLAAMRMAISNAAIEDEDQSTRVVTLVQSLIRSSTFLRMMSAVVSDESVQNSLRELGNAVLVRKSNLEGDGQLSSAIGTHFNTAVRLCRSALFEQGSYLLLVCPFRCPA